MIFWIVLMIICILLNAFGILANFPWLLCVGLFLMSIDGFCIYISYLEYKKYKEAKKILDSISKPGEAE